MGVLEEGIILGLMSIVPFFLGIEYALYNIRKSLTIKTKKGEYTFSKNEVKKE